MVMLFCLVRICPALPFIEGSMCEMQQSLELNSANMDRKEIDKTRWIYSWNTDQSCEQRNKQETKSITRCKEQAKALEDTCLVSVDNGQ